MSKYLGSYDPEQVSILIAEQEVWGFAEGEMVTVEKNSPNFNNHIGTRGEVSRAVVRDQTGIITFRLQSTSPFVKIFQEMMTASSVMQVGGFGASPIVPIRIVDPSSSAQVMAAQCWLQELPSYSWGNEVAVYEYKFFAINIVTAPNEALAAAQSIASLGNLF